MTPPASAAAARPASRQTGAVRRARRISGPAPRVSGGARVPGRAGVSGGARVSGGAVALPAPGMPARRAARRRGDAAVTPGFVLRTVRLLDGASRSALVDRLIRGRMWIGVLASALIGLVAMQLVVLKLNNQIGRTLAREVVVQRENAQLGIEGSETSSGSLVEPQAAAAGMTFAAPGTLHFLASSPRQVRRAAAALSRPIESAGAEASATEGTATTGEATTGEATTGEATTGEATTGEATTGEATAVQATRAEATTGEQAPEG